MSTTPTPTPEPIPDSTGTTESLEAETRSGPVNEGGGGNPT